jgi:hypothetical protein
MKNKRGKYKKKGKLLIFVIGILCLSLLFQFIIHINADSSDQIKIIKANYLNENKNFIKDIYEQVKEKDGVLSEVISQEEYVEIKFAKKLGSNSDITLYPIIISGNPIIEVYEKNEDVKIGEFLNLLSGGKNKIILTTLEEEQDSFYLKILSGSLVFDYITDPPGDDNNWNCSETQRFDNVSCWSLGTVPVAGENIIFNSTGLGSCNITNNSLPQNLASFTVNSDYTSTIIFNPLFAVGDWTGNNDGTQLWNVTNNINISGGTIKIYGDYNHITTAGVEGNITEGGNGQEWRSINGNITIGVGSILDGQGLGFPSAVGPGTYTTYAGGSYGGYGALNPSDPYGNATAPVSLGSGGWGGVGGTSSSPGGSGIKLQSEDTIIVNGIIDMDSGDPGSGNSGGSGGSIWLKANTIDGTGWLNASAINPRHRGGSGGRIRIEYGNSMIYDGAVSLSGARGDESKGGEGTLTFTNNTWPRDWNLTGNIGLLGGDFGDGNVINVLGDFNTNGYNISIYGDCFGNGGVYKDFVCYNTTIDGRGVWINASGNISIDSSSILDGSSFGFPSNTGPGCIKNTANCGIYGGRLILNVDLDPYGNATAPVSLGSGGYVGKITNGGSAIKLETLRDIDIGGQIDMGSNPSTIYVAGSGGSIWLKANIIQGTGVLDASGASNTGTNPSGGGGRIRLDYTEDITFNGTITVDSGNTDGATEKKAHAGTLTFTNNTWPRDWNLTGNIGLLGGDFGDGNVINVLGDFNTNGYNISIYGDCFGNGGVYKDFVCYNTTIDGRGVWINASGNISIDSSSILDGSRLGFPGEVGPGAISDPPGGGSNYGGIGSENPLPLYGSETQPISLGSGNDDALSSSYWPGGGSAIKLETSKNILVNGTLDLDAGSDEWICRASGGSIWLKANTIQGAGVLDAKGGKSSAGNRGGGGGRISLTAQESVDFSGTITNIGGYAGGGGGTVYVNATDSIISSMNISTFGFANAGNITFKSAIIDLQGYYNASNLTSPNDGGTIKINYTNCSSSNLNLATFYPGFVNLSVCISSDPIPSPTVLTPSQESLSPGGGDGSSKLFLIITNYNFYNKTILPNSIMIEKINLNNPTKTERKYSLQINSSEEIISFLKTNITIAPNSSEAISFKISSPNKTGDYSGSFIIKSGNTKKEIPFLIKIVSNLFEINLSNPPETNSFFLPYLRTTINILPLENNYSENVNIVFKIENSLGKNYTLEQGNIFIDSETKLDKTFYLNKFAPGDYTLYMEIICQEGIQTQSWKFKIEKNSFIYPLIFIFSLIIIFLIIFKNFTNRFKGKKILKSILKKKRAYNYKNSMKVILL